MYMNREEIEKKFDERFFVQNWNTPIEELVEIKSFFLDEILPEVLVNILIPVDITDCDNWYCTWVSISWKRLSNNKILWYNQCIQDIKDRAKEKYNITL